jgi:hypothetical protein
MTEENNVENLILHQLRALDAKMDRRFDEAGKQAVEAFERTPSRVCPGSDFPVVNRQIGRERVRPTSDTGQSFAPQTGFLPRIFCAVRVISLRRGLFSRSRQRLLAGKCFDQRIECCRYV